MSLFPSSSSTYCKFFDHIHGLLRLWWIVQKVLKLSFSVQYLKHTVNRSLMCIENMPENLHSVIGIIVHPGIIFPKLLDVSDECYLTSPFSGSHPSELHVDRISKSGNRVIIVSQRWKNGNNHLTEIAGLSVCFWNMYWIAPEACQYIFQ